MIDAKNLFHSLYHRLALLIIDNTMVNFITKSARIHVPQIIKITNICKISMTFILVPWAVTLTMWTGRRHAKLFEAFISFGRQIDIITTILV